MIVVDRSGGVLRDAAGLRKGLLVVAKVLVQEVFSPGEAAVILGVSQSQVYRLLEDGRLGHAPRFGSERIRVRRVDIDRLLGLI